MQQYWWPLLWSTAINCQPSKWKKKSRSYTVTSYPHIQWEHISDMYVIISCSFISAGLIATAAVWQNTRSERCWWLEEWWYSTRIVQPSCSCRGGWCSRHEMMTLTVPWNMTCVQTVSAQAGCCCAFNCYVGHTWHAGSQQEREDVFHPTHKSHKTMPLEYGFFSHLTDLCAAHWWCERGKDVNFNVIFACVHLTFLTSNITSQSTDW